jgi:hypothetical protein
VGEMRVGDIERLSHAEALHATSANASKRVPQRPESVEIRPEPAGR